MTLDQLGIVAFGVVAVGLTQGSRESWKRYAPLFGLAGQPFWFWSALHAKQEGVFVVCVLYTLAWGRGLWSHWISPWLARRRAAGLYLTDPMRRYTVAFVPAPMRTDASPPELVYLAGPVTGVAGYRDAFAYWARSLRASGYEVVSPVEHDMDDAALSWVGWTRRGLRLLLECDRIALMPGWEASAGSVVEHVVARALSMRPIYLRKPA